MAWGVFRKILTAPLKAVRSYINYKDKATSVKADALNAVSTFIPQLKTIAPVIKIADNARKLVTDPVMKFLNKIDL